MPYLGEDVQIGVTYSDCSLTIDPETSLIRAFAYRSVTERADQTLSGAVSFNVDKEPDYTIKG